jgi:hypothetical protein
MPLFLLHDIFPRGDGAGWFLLAVLLVGVLWLVSKALVLFGLVVAIARGRERLGPLDLRGVKPPSLGVWLVSLVLCVLSSVFYASESLSWIPSLVLDASRATVGNLFVDDLFLMMLVSILAASIQWTLLLTGARALRTMMRRPPARDAKAATIAR